MLPRRRTREHHAAGLVVAAEENVHDVDEPAGQGPEFDGAGAYSSIYASVGMAREFPRDSLRRFGRNSGRGCGGLWREFFCEDADLLDSVRECLEASQGNEVFAEDHIHERKQKVRITSGANEQMLVCDVRAFGPPWVHDDEAAATILDGTQLLLNPGRRH